MNLKLVVNQLQRNISFFKLVGGSADVPSAGQALITLPAAYVIPLAESAAPNSLAAGALSQQITVRFGVVLAVRNVADATGLEGLFDLDILRKQLKTTLLGWQPESEFDQITFVGGNLIKLDDDAVLWWLDTFETNYLERVT